MLAAAIVFADAHLETMDELTRRRTVASIPFGGRYRLIDFALSNLVNSDITKVAVVTERNYQSLMDHIGSGKDWDLSRRHGGLHILPPFAPIIFGFSISLFHNQVKVKKRSSNRHESYFFFLIYHIIFSSYSQDIDSFL